MVTQPLIPVNADTKVMLELLQWEASIRETKRLGKRKHVSFDELIRELMVCGSAGIVGEPTQKP